MKQEQNLQKVSFQLSDQWYENTIDLKKVYTSVHSKAKAYGCSSQPAYITALSTEALQRRRKIIFLRMDKKKSLRSA